ncbi:hypothetical protein ACWCPI_07100 [Streptomyces sp. NPDC001920]
MNDFQGRGPVQQVVYRWDGNHGRQGTGMNAVARSCDAERAEELGRELGPLLWVSGAAAARPSVVRTLSRDGDVLLVQRWPTTDRGGRPSTVSHVLVGDRGTLKVRQCLGLAYGGWRRQEKAEQASGRLPEFDGTYLHELARSRLPGMLEQLQKVEHALILATAELLRDPAQRVSLLLEDEPPRDWPDRDAVPLVYLGLFLLFGDWLGHEWTFATCDTADAHPLRLMAVPRWEEDAGGSGPLARVKGRQVQPQFEHRAAAQLVRHLLGHRQAPPGVPQLVEELAGGARMDWERRRVRLQQILGTDRTPPAGTRIPTPAPRRADRRQPSERDREPVREPERGRDRDRDRERKRERDLTGGPTRAALAPEPYVDPHRNPRPEPVGDGYREPRRESLADGFREPRPEPRAESLADGYRESRPEPVGEGYREPRPESRPEPVGDGYRESRPEPVGDGYRESRPEPVGDGYRESRPEPLGDGYREPRPEPHAEGYQEPYPNPRPEGRTTDAYGEPYADPGVTPKSSSTAPSSPSAAPAQPLQRSVPDPGGPDTGALRRELRGHRRGDVMGRSVLLAELRRQPDELLLHELRSGDLPPDSVELLLDVLGEPHRVRARPLELRHELCTEVLRQDLYFTPHGPGTDGRSGADRASRAAHLFTWAVAPLAREERHLRPLQELLYRMSRDPHPTTGNWLRQSIVEPPGGQVPDLPPQVWGRLLGNALLRADRPHPATPAPQVPPVPRAAPAPVVPPEPPDHPPKPFKARIPGRIGGAGCLLAGGVGFCVISTVFVIAWFFS